MREREAKHEYAERLQSQLADLDGQRVALGTKTTRLQGQARLAGAPVVASQHASCISTPACQCCVHLADVRRWLQACQISSISTLPVISAHAADMGLSLNTRLVCRG